MTILAILPDSSRTRSNPACNWAILPALFRPSDSIEGVILSESVAKVDSKCVGTGVLRKVAKAAKVVIYRGSSRARQE